MQIDTHVLQIATAGDAGQAVGAGAFGALQGQLIDIALDYDAAAPATTDVTISQTPAALGNILAKANSSTDGVFRPLVPACDTSGAAITGEYQPIYINGAVNVAVAGCDELSPAVTVYLRIKRG